MQIQDSKEKEVLKYGYINEKGEEVPDPNPVEINLTPDQPPTPEMMVQDAIRTVLSQKAASKGQETFEEANDFDVKDPFEIDIPSKFQLLTDEEPIEKTPYDELRRGLENEPGEKDNNYNPGDEDTHNKSSERRANRDGERSRETEHLERKEEAPEDLKSILERVIENLP